MRHQSPQTLLSEPSPLRFGLEYHSGFHATTACVEVLVTPDTDHLLAGFFNDRQRQAADRTTVP
jgi:hypothetical protein